MLSTKPYLIRAIHEWAIDNELTPQILVSATVKGAIVPQNHVKDGNIVFNLHPNAIRDLELDNQMITFSARFSGRAMQIQFPVEAVLAIYARENGQGIFFQEDQQPPPGKTDQPDSKIDTDTQSTGQPDSKSHLKLVK